MGRSLLLIFILFLVACAEEVVEKPEDLIPMEKMAEIYYDLAIINAASSTNPGTLDTHGVEVMEYLYAKHGVDSASFAGSDVYYASKPLQYQALYTVVNRRLKQEKEQMELERKRKTDSVRQAQINRDSILANP